MEFTMKKLFLMALTTFTLLFLGVAFAHDTGHQTGNFVGPDVTDESLVAVTGLDFDSGDCDANGNITFNYGFDLINQTPNGLGYSETTSYGTLANRTIIEQATNRAPGEGQSYVITLAHKEFFEGAVTDLGNNPSHPAIYRFRTVFCPPQPQPFGDMDGMNPVADDTFFILDITVGECAYNENLDADVSEVSWSLTPNGNYADTERPQGALWIRTGDDTTYNIPIPVDANSASANAYGFMPVARTESQNSSSYIGWDTGQPYMYFQMADDRLRLPNNPPDPDNIFDTTADDFTSHLTKVGTMCEPSQEASEPEPTPEPEEIEEIAATGNDTSNFFVASAILVLFGAFLCMGSLVIKKAE